VLRQPILNIEQDRTTPFLSYLLRANSSIQFRVWG